MIKRRSAQEEWKVKGGGQKYQSLMVIVALVADWAQVHQSCLHFVRKSSQAKREVRESETSVTLGHGSRQMCRAI